MKKSLTDWDRLRREEALGIEHDDATDATQLLRQSLAERRKRGGQPKPPELRRVALNLRVLPNVRAKALRLGRAELERLIERAKERGAPASAATDAPAGA